LTHVDEFNSLQDMIIQNRPFEMGVFSSFFSHVGSGSSSTNYYSSMNNALFRFNHMYTMLHYPMYRKEGESFLDAQTNLTDYCMSLLPSVKGKILLDVGCGNGVQANYIVEKYNPGQLKGIDLNTSNLDIARHEAEMNGIEGVEFCIDDAHKLETVEDNSIDFLINIESAFQYADKPAFLRQVHRVLKPGGSFLIADILTTNNKGNLLKNSWKKRMSYHHWPLESYKQELPASNLQVHSISDITPDTIRGFSCYRRWIREMDRQQLVEAMILKLYYTIHARLNIYLLKTRRQYCVFVGKKPEDSAE
jgi:ubiquinone/menaquinone biosynthesis C-methylase UbiE